MKVGNKEKAEQNTFFSEISDPFENSRYPSAKALSKK